MNGHRNTVGDVTMSDDVDNYVCFWQVPFGFVDRIRIRKVHELSNQWDPLLSGSFVSMVRCAHTGYILKRLVVEVVVLGRSNVLRRTCSRAFVLKIGCSEKNCCCGKIQHFSQIRFYTSWLYLFTNVPCHPHHTKLQGHLHLKVLMQLWRSHNMLLCWPCPALGLFAYRWPQSSYSMSLSDKLFWLG